MKRLFILFGILFCTICRGDTFNINWYVDGSNYEQTTCTTGGNINLPTTPSKYGYDFVGWEKLSFVTIEYLESTGTQYIDTGFKPNQNSGMKIDYYAKRSERPTIALTTIKVGSSNYSFGVSENSSVSNNYILIVSGEDTDFYHEPGLWRITSITGDGTGRYLVDINKRNVKVTPESGSALTHTYLNEEYQIDKPLLLFAANSINGIFASPGIINIYSCKLYDNGTLVRDFIPVLDPAGTPCLYDKVESKFYYNAGTGQFIAGPIINE